MSKFDFTCKRCGGIVLSDEVCPHGNCQDCQDFCCRKVEANLQTMALFAQEMNALRKNFPEFARELDKCLFDVGKNHLRSCGHANCGCAISFADFHAERNRIFGTINEAKSYQFN